MPLRPPPPRLQQSPLNPHILIMRMHLAATAALPPSHGAATVKFSGKEQVIAGNKEDYHCEHHWLVDSKLLLSSTLVELAVATQRIAFVLRRRIILS